MCEALGSDHQLYLDESFRTHEAGVAMVNELFAPLMGDAFAPTKAYRKQAPDGPSVEFILAAPAPGDAGAEPEPIASADESARLQADACAQRIAEILDGSERLVWDGDANHWRPARAGDIAILFARMSNSLLYERALQQRGIPYYVVAGMGFFQRQEVFDVLTALGAADNPLDDISLVGMLRGGLVGLSDNAMMHLATGLEPPYWPGLVAMRKARPSEPCLADRLAPAEAEALTRAVDLIARLHRVKDSMAIDELLRELLDETGYETALLSQFQGRRMLSNVRQVAERAAAASADHLSLADFLAEMRGMVADESRYEQAAVAGEHENVVRLMTIHKAKGLEFPVVIVPDLNAGRRGHASRLLIRDDWGATFNRPAAADADEEDAAKPLSFRLANRLETADGRAEDFRKLYVAATRHEDHLIFLGADYRNKDGSLRDSDSYLAAIDGVMNLTASLENAAPGATGDGEAGADLRCEIPYAGGKFRAGASPDTGPTGGPHCRRIGRARPEDPRLGDRRGRPGRADHQGGPGAGRAPAGGSAADDGRTGRDCRDRAERLRDLPDALSLAARASSAAMLRDSDARRCAGGRRRERSTLQRAADRADVVRRRDHRHAVPQVHGAVGRLGIAGRGRARRPGGGRARHGAHARPGRVGG